MRYKIVGWMLISSPVVLVLIAMAVNLGPLVASGVLVAVAVLVGMVAAGMALIDKGDKPRDATLPGRHDHHNGD